MGALAPRLNAFASDTGDDTAALGKAVQVDPVKPMLKPPETKRLKPKCDGPLSNFAFEFNLRRYNEGLTMTSGTGAAAAAQEKAPMMHQPVGPGGLCSPRPRLQFKSRTRV